MEGGQDKIPQTPHLPHFRGSSVEGGTIIAPPGMLSADFHGRWTRKDTTDPPPATLSRQFRGRWYYHCTTWHAFRRFPWKVGKKRYHRRPTCHTSAAILWKVGHPSYHLACFRPISMEGGQEKIPQTSHLPHFRGNSVEGDTIIAPPGMLSADFYGRWASPLKQIQMNSVRNRETDTNANIILMIGYRKNLHLLK